MRLILIAALFASFPATAFEGHWRPHQLEALEAELTSIGLGIPLEQMEDLEAFPLGAIVDLEYCSASFVSSDGLVVTAYHCATDQLQFASREGEDLFHDGFYAPTRAEERWSGPRERVRITTEVEDVTDDVLAGTKRLSGASRLEKIESNIKGLVKRCENKDGVACDVATYGDGTEYELITQLEIRDVRVVMAPPNNVGYFGGDADNWRWPRHSGDFAFLRAYVGPDGKPADYHPDNVPYQPEHYLPVAEHGPKSGDFVMVAGYPGGTYRWQSAAELDFAQEERYPLVIEIRRDLLDILGHYMADYPDLEGKLAPRRLNLSNDLVYLEGTLAQFERAQVAEEKWEFEQDLSKWIAADEERSEAYGHVLDTIHRLQAEEAATAERDYLFTQMVKQVGMLQAATTLYKLSIEAAKPDKERDSGYQNRDRPKIADSLDQLDAAYDWRVDRDIFEYFLVRAMQLPPGDHIAEFDLWLAYDPDGDLTLEEHVEMRVDELYENVDLADSDKRRDLMGTSTWYLTHSGNPWFDVAAALHPFLERIDEEHDVRESEWREFKPQYIKALQEFVPEARPRYVASTEEIAPGLYYADANSTLRLTFGKVDGYFPRDGLIATTHSTLRGITGKAGAEPYTAPEDLLEAIGEAEYGPYNDESLESVPVNYLSTLDTARGSSGSSTMNADGEFVGIVFDGNYEAIASDWIFDEALTRTIHTDVEYILWYLDRVAGAYPLLEELGREPYFAKGDGGEESEAPAAGDSDGASPE